MTVKVAAEHLAVSRPTLSNLLNGKAKLSPEMATRLEKAFGVGREKLLGLQAVWDEYQTSDMADNLPVRRHVPVYLKITAHQLENWADKIEARSELSVLLRKFLYSCKNFLAKIAKFSDSPKISHQ